MAETRRENLVGRNLWADILKMRDEQRENLKGAIQIVRREDLPLESNEQGLMRWYMHPAIKDICLHTMIFFEQEIPPAGRSGRVKFQGGQVIFVVEGRGLFVDSVVVEAGIGGLISPGHRRRDDDLLRLRGGEGEDRRQRGDDQGAAESGR